MNSHYFTNEDKNNNKIHNITYYYKEHLLSLTSSDGIFSKNHIDFGTHTLLKYLEVDQNIVNVLDVGCGIGVIGLALAKAHPELRFEMIDVNLRAIELANLNAKNNKINNAVAYESNLFENVKMSFDLVISNPPIRAGKNIVHGIVDGAFSHLKINGQLWIVIQKKQGANSMVNKMTDVFGNCQIIVKETGYWILKSTKGS